MDAISGLDKAEMLAAPDAVWNSLRGARIFVTGGTGFFGHALIQSFLYANDEKQLGATLTLLSRDPNHFHARFPDYFTSGAIHTHTGDVRDFTAPDTHFTHIIHAATESSGGQGAHDDVHMAETILDGTRHVLKLAKATNAKLLYISSGAVYGRARPQPIPVTETDAGAPSLTDRSIAYDESKRMAEVLCLLYARDYGVRISIARGFSFVGPYLPLNTHFAIGNFIGDALAGRNIVISGDGTAVRSYLHTADLARWLWTMLAIGDSGEIYNLGSDAEVSIASLARHVQQLVNPKVKVEVKGTSVAGAPISYQVPDINKAALDLGLRPLISLDEAIRRTADWHRAHPEAIPPQPAATSNSILAKPDVVVFDFDGVMTDNRVILFQDGREAVACDRSDGLGIGMLKKAGIPMLVLSTEKNPVVGERCKKLGLEWLQGIDTKEVVLAQWLKDKGYDPTRTIYLGNDVNDLGCLKLVGLPAVVGDAYPEAKRAAKLVLTRHGGKGAVRELIDRILAARA